MAALTALPDVGAPDYGDEGMLQYLRAERIVPPYQTRGYKLVVYGHTHLLKDVALPAQGGRYLNTGTWADLLVLPDDVLQPDDAGFQKVYDLVERLKENRLDGLRGQVPSYARIEIGDGGAMDAGLFVFHGPDRQQRVQPSSLQELAADTKTGP